MKITILAVGKAKGKPEAILALEYIKRLPWRISIIEVEEKKPLSGQERMDSEGQKILKALPENVLVVALDKSGEVYSSSMFAKAIQKWQLAGHSHIAFIIGGADGLSQAVYEVSTKKLSFGAMTWPHQLARVMLLEQLYRCHAILSGHPYHK